MFPWSVTSSLHVVLAFAVGELAESGSGELGAELGQLGRPEESLLESGEAARLADEDVSNLAHLNADEEHGVTGVLLVQTLTKCLQARTEQRQPEPGWMKSLRHPLHTEVPELPSLKSQAGLQDPSI